MKKYTVILTLFATCFCLNAANVSIEWENPDEYTDLGRSFHDDANIEIFSKELEPYIERVAKDHLPDTVALELTVTDVDLAGDFEPWRLNDDVRIVRSIYPPRMKIMYKMYDTIRRAHRVWRTKHRGYRLRF